MPSIGSVGDSFDNALAETVNGLYKTELIPGPGQRPWRTVDDVELATLGWVHWHNTARIHGYLGDVPRRSSRRPTLTNEPTSNWLESSNPSLDRTQGASEAPQCSPRREHDRGQPQRDERHPGADAGAERETGRVIVDCAVYDSGVRREGELQLEEALEAAHSSPDTFVWIGLHEPTEDEFVAVVEEFELHPLAVEDAVHAHQRPKLEAYGPTLFVVLKPARYVDPEETVSLSEIMLFLGDGFLITVRHGESSVLGDVRRALEDDHAVLKGGPLRVLHAIADQVVDDYMLVVRELNSDIEEIERQVFSEERRNHAERIYRLKAEVLEFRQAIIGLEDPLNDLASGKVAKADSTLLEYFRNVHDHVLRVAQRIEAIDNLLSSALTANLAQVGVRQNEDMRKISAWVAIVAVPTMIAGIYGMNFEHMPELGWLFGYPFALAIMASCCAALYVLFRRRDWL